MGKALIGSCLRFELTLKLAQSLSALLMIFQQSGQLIALLHLAR
jgi:hypothetical protein